MPKGFYRDIARILAEHGFARVKGGKGSHEKWRNDRSITVTVPHNLYSRHTANTVLKEAGIDRKL